MQYETLKAIIDIFECKDGGAVRKALNDCWGFQKTQEIVKELREAVDVVARGVGKVPYAQLIITNKSPFGLKSILDEHYREENAKKGFWIE